MKLSYNVHLLAHLTAYLFGKKIALVINFRIARAIRILSQHFSHFLYILRNMALKHGAQIRRDRKLLLLLLLLCLCNTQAYGSACCIPSNCQCPTPIYLRSLCTSQTKFCIYNVTQVLRACRSTHSTLLTGDYRTV